MSCELHLGDCLEVMRGMADKSVDCVVTDPPYGIGYKMNAPNKQTNGHRNTSRTFGVDALDTSWIADAYRVLKPNTCAYVFTRWDVLHIWRAAIEDAGFSVAQRLIWDKSHWGAGDLRYYGSQIEDVLFCRKGNPTMAWAGRRGNVFKSTTRAFYPERSDLHPTQKPESVMTSFVLDSTQPGDTILDPFMGSGTTGVACIKTGRNFIGCEIDPTYHAIAQRRIEDAAAQPMLFEAS